MNYLDTSDLWLPIATELPDAASRANNRVFHWLLLLGRFKAVKMSMGRGSKRLFIQYIILNILDIARLCLFRLDTF